jgi:hypothetical protein
MFGFPVLFPLAFIQAVGAPFLGIIAVTLYWATGAATGMVGLPWLLTITNGALFSWLAVRCHRLVLLGESADEPGSRLKCVTNYFAGLVIGTALLTLAVMVFLDLFLLPFSRYVPAGAGAGPDPELDSAFRVSIYAAEALACYFLARLAPALPAFALGDGWDLKRAWRCSRGNGWRLALIMFLLPQGFEILINSIYGAIYYSVAIAVLAIFKAFLSAESVIALSLAYRELVPPAPPPTTPPA